MQSDRCSEQLSGFRHCLCSLKVLLFGVFFVCLFFGRLFLGGCVVWFFSVVFVSFIFFFKHFTAPECKIVCAKQDTAILMSAVVFHPYL